MSEPAPSVRGRVYLWGFMGSGKSSVGRRLAARLDLPFVDLDDAIEAAAGRTIPEIFAQEGEDGFRALEARCLADLEPHVGVVACGGGTPTREAGRRRMLESGGVCVWLDVPFALVLDRLDPVARAARPLFEDVGAARALYDARREFYRHCDVRIAVQADDTIEDVADRILRRLRESS